MPQLPNSRESEAALLGILIQTPSLILEAQAILKPEHFFTPEYQHAYEIIISMDADNQPINASTILPRLQTSALHGKDAHSFIQHLAQAFLYADSETATQHAQTILNHARLRRLHATAQQIQKQALEPNASAQQLLLQTENTLFEQIQNTQIRTSRTAKDICADHINDIIHRHEHDRSATSGIPTKYKSLDHMTGGFQPSDLIIIAARPSVGKTSFALNLAYRTSASIITDPLNQERYQPEILFFSIEMSESQIIQRLICTHGQIPSSLVRKNMLNSQQLDHYYNAAQQISMLPIHIVDDPQMDPTKMRLIAKRIKAQSPRLSMIIIDYISLMHIPGYRRERHQEVSDISRSLKAIARELNLPIIALSQLSRDVEKGNSIREPRLSDLRESGSIEQDADVVLFLHRPEAKNLEADNQLPTPVQLILAKQRNGPTGKIPMLFVDKFTLFAEESKPIQ